MERRQRSGLQVYILSAAACAHAKLSLTWLARRIHGADLEATVAADAEAAAVAEAERALMEQRSEAVAKELEALRSEHSSVETRLTGLQSTHEELAAAHEDKHVEAEQHRAAYRATREAVGASRCCFLDT